METKPAYTVHTVYPSTKTGFIIHAEDAESALLYAKLGAECSARQGEISLYRVFGPSGYVGAWLSDGASVIPHDEVTIPAICWHS